MKNQRGVALSGLIFWGFVIALLAVFGMKVVPTTIEYYKIVKNTKTVVAQASPDATVGDIKRAYERFADIDNLELKSSDLEISKESGRIVISFAYEKKIPLFFNVSLVIDYQGSTAN